jgi:hypothetical protein
LSPPLLRARLHAPVIFLCLVPEADSLSVHHQSRSLLSPACFSARLEFSGHCGARLGVLPPASINFVREQACPTRFPPAHFLLHRLTRHQSLIRSHKQSVLQISSTKLLLSDLAFRFLLISFGPHEEWYCPCVVFVLSYLSIL